MQWLRLYGCSLVLGELGVKQPAAAVLWYDNLYATYLLVR
jgi:hypothetical protein